MSRKFDNQ